MKWNNWEKLDSKCDHAAAAVYEFRLVSEKSQPYKFPRWFAVDKNGILSIGETGDMQKRLKQFINGFNRCNGHSEANLLFLINKHCSLNDIFSNYEIEYRYIPVSSKEYAKQCEEILIKDYVKSFGEVPPLNSAIPKRYGEW